MVLKKRIRVRLEFGIGKCNLMLQSKETLNRPQLRHKKKRNKNNEEMELD